MQCLIKCPPTKTLVTPFSCSQTWFLLFKAIYRTSQTELREARSQSEVSNCSLLSKPANSPIQASMTFAKKRDGTLQMCTEFRALNKLTKKYPFPSLEDG